MKFLRQLFLACACVSGPGLLVLTSAEASNNIDLSTAPPRASVQLTIYNSEDLTLVRERRVMSFNKGRNQLQFSWANTLIDPTSVELRFPRNDADVTLEDTTFSHIRKDALVWNVMSEIEGEVETEISYFTSGLTWSADYTLIANDAESTARLDGFIRVHNNSGERYENAEVRVVVGKINLVQKIADLARVPVKDVAKLDVKKVRQLRSKAMRGTIGVMNMMSAEAAPQPVAAPKQIIKEGLSEYFMYTVEGTETIANGWSKRLRSFDAAAVPLELKYRLRPREYGPDLVRLYIMTNDQESGLGSTPLPNGKLMVYRDDGAGGLDMLVSRNIKYVPVGDKLEVNLGKDPDVTLEMRVLSLARKNLWLKLRRPNAFKRVGDGTTVLDHRATVAGWDDHAVIAHVIRNFTSRAVDVEIRAGDKGDLTVVSELRPKQHDFKTFEVATNVDAGETLELLYEFIVRQGRNKKQNRVELVHGKVEKPVY